MIETLIKEISCKQKTWSKKELNSRTLTNTDDNAKLARGFSTFRSSFSDVFYYLFHTHAQKYFCSDDSDSQNIHA